MGAGAAGAEPSGETIARPAWYQIFAARQLIRKIRKILFYKTMT
jgi:hypothetical protein